MSHEGYDRLSFLLAAGGLTLYAVAWLMAGSAVLGGTPRAATVLALGGASLHGLGVKYA